MASKEPAERDYMGYIRVSKVAGRSGTTFHSPEMQLDVVKRGVSDVHGRFVDYKYDPDRSGYQDIVREGWDAAVEWVMEDPKHRGIAAYDTSRLSRSLFRLLGDVQHRIVPAGGRVIVPGDGIDTDQADWQDKIQMLGMFAERQSRKIGEKWTGVLASRAEKGTHPTGRQIYGYVKVPDPEEPKASLLVPDEDGGTAEVVRRMYRLYNGGTGLREVARVLNEDGIPSPGAGRVKKVRQPDGSVEEVISGSTWGISTVKRTLDSKAYVGILEFKGEDLPAAWEPLISQSAWNTYLSERRRREKIPKKAQVPKWTLGGGFAVCGKCGSPLTVNSLAKPNGMVMCGSYRGARGCEGVFMVRVRFDVAFTVMLWNWMDDVSRLASAEHDAESKRVAEDASATIREGEERLDVITSARTKLAMQNAEGLITDDELTKSLREYAKEARDVHDRIAAARDRIAAATPLGDAYDNLLHDFSAGADTETLAAKVAAGTEDLTVKEWMRSLRTVIRRVELHDDKIVFVPVIGEDDENKWRTVKRDRKVTRRRKRTAKRVEWDQPVEPRSGTA